MRKISKKIVLLGHFGVGKTSLIRQFVHSKFSEEYISTIGVKVDKKEVVLGDTTLNMLIWDVAGETSFDKVRANYLLGSHGFLYVFDLSRPSTYQQISEDLKLISEKYKGVPVTVVGNKADLIDETKLAEIREDDSIRMDLVSSAKSGKNVEKAFEILGERMLK